MIFLKCRRSICEKQPIFRKSVAVFKRVLEKCQEIICEKSQQSFEVIDKSFEKCYNVIEK